MKQRQRYFAYRILTILAAFLIHSNSFGSEFQWFWVFYERGTHFGSTYQVYRPFAVQYSYPNEKFSGYLMPVIYWEYVTPRQHIAKGLFSFYQSVKYQTNDHYEKDVGFFPFLLYGVSTSKEDTYLHVWPFGGTIKGKLAQDEITTFLFPGVLLFFLYPSFSYIDMVFKFIVSMMPLYVNYKSNDYRAHGVLWPIVQWGKSPTRDDMRIFPFYAHSKKEGFYDTYSIGLLFNVRKEYIGDDTMNTVFFAPFYARRWLSSGKAESSAILWPFFSWGYNEKHGNFELNFPWPLVQLRDCNNPYIYKRIFFPFYGKYIERNFSTTFVTPLYFALETKTDIVTSYYGVYGLLFWYFKRDYANNHARYGYHWRYYKLWPLFHYEYNDRGDSNFALLSILPFRDEEGYERLYQPFFSLIEFTTIGGTEKRFGFLLRTYYQIWNDSICAIKIPFLFSYMSYNNSVQYVSLLFSFISFRNDDTLYEVRIAWIPVYRYIKNQKAFDEEQTEKIRKMYAMGQFRQCHIWKNEHCKNLENVFLYSFVF